MPQLAMECAIRAALLGAGTASALWILRVRAAWARHAAWTGMLILMMLLPLWTAWGPKLRLQVLPATPVAPSAAPLNLPVPVFDGQETKRPDVAPAPERRVERDWMLYLYLLGVAALLGRLLTGTVRAQLLVRRASLVNGRLTSDACSAPVTVGALKPKVILPACWTTWPQSQLAAVLAHEAAHARRRDPLVQWLALLNRAVFWFHPLAWWLERQLSALAEEACDAVVLEGGCDPLAYSEYLLEMARSVLQTGTRIKVLGMAMPGSFLSKRIRSILERRPSQRITSLRLTGLGVACAAVAAVCTAGAVDRRTAEPKMAMLDFPALYRPPAPAVKPVLLAEVQAPQTASPPPQTSAPKFDAWRLLVLYFDLETMPAAERTRAFLAAQLFVRTKMQPTDLISVITANPEVKVLQDFTEDRDGLVGTLDRLLADSGPDRSAVPDADRQIASLQTAVQILGALKQKKALIYFGAPQFGIDPAQRKPLIDEAIRANVAFYRVDADGLIEAPANQKPYVIGPLDELQIRVLEQGGISGQYQVRPDGIISMPFIGDVQAAGRTVMEVEAAITDALKAKGILVNPAVTVGVAAIHQGK